MDLIFQMVRAKVPLTKENASDHKRLVAKAFHDFLLWQYKDAAQEKINAQCKVNAFKGANAAAEREYRESNEIGFGGRLPLPYSEAQIKLQEGEAARAEENVYALKIMLDYYVETLINKTV